MNSPTHFKKTLFNITILSVLTTTLLLQYSHTKKTIKITQKKQYDVTHLIKTYQTKIQQKTSKKTLIKTILNRLNGTIIKDHIKTNIHYIKIQTQKNNETLINVISDLKNYYGPINEIAIDLLHQTIELRFPLTK